MKTVTEWSAEFDVLWNNIMSNQAPGLNGYEKSVFLTRAQEQFVKDYFTRSTSPTGEGFDDREIRQADFSSLIDSADMIVADPTNKYNTRSTTKYYKFPDDVFIPINERVTDTVGTVIREFEVVPISYNEYRRLMTKPYKYPAKGIAWRVITTLDSEPVVELIGRFHGTLGYKVRYVKNPEPIILEALTSPLKINGKDTISTCLLPEHTHQEILRRAVFLAKSAWIDQQGDVPRNNQ